MNERLPQHTTVAPPTGVAHIAIATHDADALAVTLVQALGAKRGIEELFDDGGMRIVFVHVGPVTIELLEPRRDDHTVAKFLASRGPGLHHVSLEVENIQESLAQCRAAGVRLIDETPRGGAHSKQVAFLHPKSLGGVLIELSQRPEETEAG